MIKRGLLATYWINIRDWAVGDVMWSGADDHTADSASLETINQRPSIPCLHAQPYPVKLPFNPQRPHACQTRTSHHHGCLPLSYLPLGNVQTIVTAHHTSNSNLTRNQMFGALLQMNPCAVSRAEFNSNSVSALPYNQAAITVLKS